MKAFQARTSVAGVATQGHSQQVERKTEDKGRRGLGWKLRIQSDLINANLKVDKTVIPTAP